MKKYIRVSIITFIIVLLNGCGYSDILSNTESPDEVIESNDEHILNPNSYDETDNYNYVFIYKYPHTSNEEDIVNKLYLNVTKVNKSKESIVYRLTDGYIEVSGGTAILYLNSEQKDEYYITLNDFAIVPKYMLDSKITTDDIVDGFLSNNSDNEEELK